MYNPFLPVVNSLLPEPQASLLNGILFGVKASMPKAFYQSLIATGTLHIIALSGINITILIALISQCTSWLGKKLSLVITIIFISSFVVFVGCQPSIVRAAIMGSFSLLSIYFGRQSLTLLTLFFAAGIMLLADFSLIGNLSFQLSFFATAGIILAGGRGDCQTGKKRLSQQFISWFKKNLRLTLSAQLFTLPIILYNFHRISLVAPLANLAIEWVIQPVMVLGFAAVILGFICLPLGTVFAWIVWVPLTYLITIIELLAKIPGASIKL